MRILSAVPKQYNKVEDKFDWIINQCRKHSPDILVTPQEYFGGAVMMSHQKSFAFRDLFPKLKTIAKENTCALVVGVVEKTDKGNYETIWFINEKGEFLGKLNKFALPKYDHVSTKGFGNILPETDFESRFKVFEIKGMKVTSIFCWEVYSDLLWTGLGLIKPDIVFSQIKFGVNSWPIVRPNKKTDTNDVQGFGYGTWSEDGKWIERLKMANVWQVKCPIICSTNSWNLRPISMPLCGCISGIDGQAKDTLWHPKKEDKLKDIPEMVVVDDINHLAIRAALQNKFMYKEVTGEFPPFSLGKFTMMLKINRVEDRIISGREQASVDRKESKRTKDKLNIF